MKNRRKLLAFESGKGSRLVPGDVRDRILRLAFGKILARPTARPRQSGAVLELLHRVFPGKRLTVFDERVLPILLLQVAACVDELFVLLIAYFIFINQKIVEM